MREKLEMLALKAEVLEALREGATSLEAAQDASADLTTVQLLDLLLEDPDLLNAVVSIDHLVQDYAPSAATALILAVEERLFDWAEEQPEATK